MTTVRAHFDGKHFVPDEPVSLPEGTPVMVNVSPNGSESPLQDILDLAEKSPITDGPSDWSEQHDHYIRNAPKR